MWHKNHFFISFLTRRSISQRFMDKKSVSTPHSIRIITNPTVSTQAVCELRSAVGWGGLEGDYPAAFAGYWATIGVFDRRDQLVGWCAILSDGVRHSILIDVIVHPSRQRQGLGQRIVSAAVDHCRQQGVSIIHVDFTPENRGFYEKCGFRIGLAGIINL